MPPRADHRRPPSRAKPPPRADHRRPPAARLNRTRILSNLHKMLGIDAAAPRAAGRRPPPAAPPKGQSRAYNPSFQGEVLDHEEPVASRRAKLNNSFKCGGWVVNLFQSILHVAHKCLMDSCFCLKKILVVKRNGVNVFPDVTNTNNAGYN